MKLSNYEQVKELINTRERLHDSLPQIAKFSNKIANKTEETDKPYYWCHLNEYSDGSGASIDFNGCGIAENLLEAARKVVMNEIDNIDEQLKELGVEFN